MKLQKKKLSTLKPLEVNVRKHTEKQIKELIRSVNQFGQTRAIVIDEENNILIGNGLHSAMVQAGMEEAFVYCKNGLSETEKKKLILADNKTFSLGTDDYENIEAYLEEIAATADYDVAGFEEDVLKNLIREADEILQDVKSYGVLSDDVLEQKKQVAEQRESQPQNVFEAPDQQAEGKEKEVATVICPNCGECIPLD